MKRRRRRGRHISTLSNMYSHGNAPIFNLSSCFYAIIQLFIATRFNWNFFKLANFWRNLNHSSTFLPFSILHYLACMLQTSSRSVDEAIAFNCQLQCIRVRVCAVCQFSNLLFLLNSLFYFYYLQPFSAYTGFNWSTIKYYGVHSLKWMPFTLLNWRVNSLWKRVLNQASHSTTNNTKK